MLENCSSDKNNTHHVIYDGFWVTPNKSRETTFPYLKKKEGSETWHIQFQSAKLKLFLSYFYHFLRFDGDLASRCTNIDWSQLPVLLALPDQHGQTGSSGRIA